MRITKIEGTSSYINVHINDEKIVKIQGEIIVGGFCAYRDTIKQWEPPYDNELIDDCTRDELIKAIIDKSMNSVFRIEFD